MGPATIYLFKPISAVCKEWFEENVDCPFQAMGGYPVESRYAQDLIDGLESTTLEYGVDYEIIY